jgi:bis(5'-nucleosyl)-tetraphosphatase (symmetrical)
MKNIVVYGDIHGCLDEFKKLRKKVDLKPDDLEISVGDFLNKGPYSIETFHYILNHNIKAILGNNEVKTIKQYKRYKKEGKKYLKSLRQFEIDTILKVTKNELKLLQSLPHYLKFSNLTIVHGGVMPDTVLSEKLDKKSQKVVTLLRYVNKDLEPIPWSDFDGRYKFWTELYKGHEGFVVYGHHPFEEPRVDKFSLGIDTGCVYGKKLTAVKFKVKKDGMIDTDNYKLLSVESKKNYWKEVRP